jgi:quinol monooxygenase YgiN
MDVIAKVVLKDKFRPKFEQKLAELLPLTLAEEGCERFEAYRDVDNSHAFWLVETWRSQGALDHHYAQPYVRALIDNYDTWLAEPLTVVKLTPFGGGSL